jgi:hypothetical protein
VVAMNPKVLIVLVLLGGSLLLSACGSGPKTASTSTTTTGVTQNLALTPAVRKSLLDAAAAYHQLPASDYVGLRTGAIYYAFDPATNSYYAAAGLNASPHSLKAQVGTQDDGAYNLFLRAADTKKWTVYNDGLGGAQDSTCTLIIPSAVLKVWNWKAKSCYPPS